MSKDYSTKGKFKNEHENFVNKNISYHGREKQNNKFILAVIVLLALIIGAIFCINYADKFKKDKLEKEEKFNKQFISKYYWEHITPGQLTKDISIYDITIGSNISSSSPLLMAIKYSDNLNLIKKVLSLYNRKYDSLEKLIFTKINSEKDISASESLKEEKISSGGLGNTVLGFAVQNGKNPDIVNLLIDSAYKYYERDSYNMNNYIREKRTEIINKVIIFALKNKREKIADKFDYKKSKDYQVMEAAIEYSSSYEGVINFLNYGGNIVELYNLFKSNQSISTQKKDLIINNYFKPNLLLFWKPFWDKITTEQLKIFISKYDINFKFYKVTKVSESILESALRCTNNIEMIKYIAERDYFRDNTPGSDGVFYTAAMYTDNPEIIYYLAKKGYDINKKSRINRFTPLMAAAEYNSNPKIIDALFHCGAELNTIDSNSNGYCPVIVAAYYNEVPVIQQLIDLNAKILGWCPYGNIVECIKKNKEIKHDPAYYKLLESLDATVKLSKADFWKNASLEQVSSLLKNRPYLNLPSVKDVSSILITAVKNTDNPELIKLLIKNGANVNLGVYKNNSYFVTPLSAALSMNKNPEILKDLIDSGADINSSAVLSPINSVLKTTSYYKTIAHKIKESKDKDASPNASSFFNKNFWSRATITDVSSAIKNGAEIQGGFSLKTSGFMNALAYCNNSNIIRYLLDNGANATSGDDLNPGPIFIAAKYSSSPEVIKILVDHGANINQKVKIKDPGTPLLTACQFNKNKAVLSEFIKLNGKNQNLSELLNYAVFGNNINAVKLLIKNGANTNGTYKGISPLLTASATDKTGDIIKSLIKSGADINRISKNLTPLMGACLYNNYSAVRTLINLGADPNIRDNQGFTAVFYAADFAENAKILSFLIKSGANIHMKSNDGGSIFDYVNSNKNNESIMKLTGIMGMSRDRLIDAVNSNDKNGREKLGIIRDAWEKQK